MNLIKKINNRADARGVINNNLMAIKKLYITQDLTAKEVAKIMRVEFNDFWVKALNDEFKKANHGGPRQGAGNHKGGKGWLKLIQTLSSKKEDKDQNE